MTAAGRYLEDSPATTIDDATKVLAGAGTVIFPTDTVYGLLAAAGSPSGYQRIYELKRRPPGKPLALLVGEGSRAALAVTGLLAGHPQAGELFSSGQLTLVISPAELPPSDLASHVAAIQPGNIGLRLPRHPELRSLITQAGGCLWATSANAAGDPPPATAQAMLDALPRLAGPPDLVILSRNPLPGSPSRLALLDAGRLEWLSRGP